MRKHKKTRQNGLPTGARYLSVCALIVAGAVTAQAQYDRSDTGALTAGSTANFRFADMNELPITITLLGAVQRPGRYEISRKMDLVNLLALAGGWQESADMSDVRINREKVGADPGGRAELKLDLDNLTEISPKFLQLQEGDCIYVGTSKRLTLPTILSIVSTASAIAVALAYVTLAKK